MPLPSDSRISPSSSTFSPLPVTSFLVSVSRARARAGHGNRSARSGDRGRLDVVRLDALCALALLEHDLRTLGERLVSPTGDVAVVDEDIFAALVGRDESVTLRIAEPLHGSSCHRKNTSLADSRTGRR